MENKPVNIFWTGGWDSTFRVLQLLIEENRKVQPHFVVRHQASVGKEITTMIDIRRELFSNYPGTRKLLKPTIYVDLRAVKKNNNKKQQFAMQYDFCSRYCEQNKIHDMELSNEKGGRIQGIIKNFLEGKQWRDIDEMSEKESMYYEVFKYFKFPLINTTKPEMKEKADVGGWGDILEMTWFCASPNKGKPCGFCGPCTYVVDEGLSRRLPFFRRLLSISHMPFRKFYRETIKYGNFLDL